MRTDAGPGLESDAYWELLIKKSVSRFFLLSVLSQRPMHGYEIAKSIESCCEGYCKPTDGMIYPTIKELVNGGYIECVPEVIGGRRRNVCHLTANGKEAYRAAARVWAGVLPYLETSVNEAGVGIGRNGAASAYPTLTRSSDSDAQEDKMPQGHNQQVKELVQDHYSATARGATECCDTSCCAPSEDGEVQALYTAEETEDLPDGVLMASAGCGNPTAMASLQPGETVVDFGSGGGIDCFLAARAVGPQGRVIGVDMTPDMVTLARNNARRLGLTNVAFHLAEMERTPLSDESADVLISNCVINLAPDKDAVFQEAFRVLRPGGRLFVSDMVLVEELPPEATADIANWVACLAGAELKTTYLDRMRAVGFAHVQVLSETRLGRWDGWRSRVKSMNITALRPR